MFLSEYLSAFSLKVNGRIPVLLISVFFSTSLSAQAPDYRSEFGSSWIKAEAFISDNFNWMKDYTERYDIEFTKALSIVFPELIRYSAIRDVAETTMLKTLYINLGDEYADFSIGYFQMKPSFAEALMEKVWSLNDSEFQKIFKGREEMDDKKIFRSGILADLEDPVRQFEYLMAFIKICEKEYPVKIMPEEDAIRFLATAYNCGLNKSESYIWQMEGKKFFSTGLTKNDKYSYSDISLFWYLNSRGRIITRLHL
jgi:hypothetical protein